MQRRRIIHIVHACIFISAADSRKLNCRTEIVLAALPALLSTICSQGIDQKVLLIKDLVFCFLNQFHPFFNYPLLGIPNGCRCNTDIRFAFQKEPTLSKSDDCGYKPGSRFLLVCKRTYEHLIPICFMQVFSPGFPSE